MAFSLHQLGRQDTGNLLLCQSVGGLLEICIDGQIDIISCNRILGFLCTYNT